jgi:hypothetical protein
VEAVVDFVEDVRMLPTGQMLLDGVDAPPIDLAAT